MLTPNPLLPNMTPLSHGDMSHSGTKSQPQQPHAKAQPLLHTKTPTNDPTHKLPVEIWLQAFSYLDYKSLLRVGMTNRYLMHITETPYLWKSLCLRHGVSLSEEILNDSFSLSLRMHHTHIEAEVVSGEIYKSVFVAYQKRVREALRSRIFASMMKNIHLQQLKEQQEKGKRRSNGREDEVCLQCQIEREEMGIWRGGSSELLLDNAAESPMGSLRSPSAARTNSNHNISRFSSLGELELSDLNNDSQTTRTFSSSPRSSSPISIPIPTTRMNIATRGITSPVIDTISPTSPRSAMILHTLNSGCDFGTAVKEFRYNRQRSNVTAGTSSTSARASFDVLEGANDMMIHGTEATNQISNLSAGLFGFGPRKPA